MQGQINRGWEFGDTLYGVASQPNVKRCVEIGTLTGEGSTRVIAEALEENGGRLESIELKRDNYECACSLFKGREGRVDLLWGLSLTVDHYRPYAYYHALAMHTKEEREHPGRYRQWYQEELAVASGVPRQGLLRDVLRDDPTPIDLVLFDGGEFLSNDEFWFLEPFIQGYVLMDDTNPERCIKNGLARQWLLESDDWEVITDQLEQRNGWLCARRKED